MAPKVEAVKPQEPKSQIQAYNSKADAMRAHLGAQKKVMFFIPMTEGQPPEYTVNLNGCLTIVPVGEKVELPEQVAEILDARMRSDGMMKQKSEAMMGKMNAGGAA